MPANKAALPLPADLQHRPVTLRHAVYKHAEQCCRTIKRHRQAGRSVCVIFPDGSVSFYPPAWGSNG